MARFARVLAHLVAVLRSTKVQRGFLIVSALVVSHAIGIEAQTLVVLLIYLWPPISPSPLTGGGAPMTPRNSVREVKSDIDAQALLVRLRDAEGPERERLRMEFRRRIRQELDQIWNEGGADRGEHNGAP